MPGNEGKVIFGFTGLMACGKGTAAKYLEEKYGSGTYRFSTMLRDVLNRIHLEQSRDHMIKISECLRAAFGENTMARTVAKDVEKDTRAMIVVDGIRRVADIEFLAALPNFVLVEIFADPRVRYERLVRRGENSDDASKTFEQFIEDHKRSTEMTIPEVAAGARERVDNNGGMADFQKQLDELVRKYAPSGT